MAHNPVDHVLDEPWIGPVTKYQILVVAAAAIVAAIYIPLARRIRTGEAPRGTWWNFFESILVYIRNEVARPNIHDPHDRHHETADRFVPFLWTVFLFILVSNLLGMVPGLGSPTASLSVTIALAGFAFLTIHVSALAKLGLLGYVKSYIPTLKTDSKAMNVALLPVVVMVAAIEVMGAVIRGLVLAIRLFANLFAGHVALAVIVSFVGAALAAEMAWHMKGAVTIGSILMALGLSVLELFVAFLQAFVFTLLTSIFLGMALHPEH
jgi:F-type H+-transporting ATPase subunit a